ncbi:MAG: FCD domain-containing protein [Pusillimonas sp.]
MTTKGNSTAAGRLYTELRRDIIAGTWFPRQRLRISEVAARYAGGAIPVREALNRLAAESLVTYSDQRGFSIAPASAGDLRDLTAARMMISEIALREAIRKGDAEWEESILITLHRLNKVPRYVRETPSISNAAYEQPHKAFHQALLSGCGSGWMLDVHGRLFDHAERYRALSRATVLHSRDEEHGKIAEAAIRRDEDEAVRLIKLHIGLTAELVLDASLPHESLDEDQVL